MGLLKLESGNLPDLNGARGPGYLFEIEITACEGASQRPSRSLAISL